MTHEVMANADAKLVLPGRERVRQVLDGEELATFVGGPEELRLWVRRARHNWELAHYLLGHVSARNANLQSVNNLCLQIDANRIDGADVSINTDVQPQR
jgi:hypothetical protein